MAEKVVEDPLKWLGWALSAILGLFAVITQLRKAKVDESALVLGKWKELVETHEAAISRINDEFGRYREQANSELDRLKRAYDDLERKFAEYRAETDEKLRTKDEQITGLLRAIAQNSKSAAHMLTRPADAAVSKTKRPGENDSEKGP